MLPSCWLSSSATGKARSAIRRYWQDKSTENYNTIEKNYSSTIEIDLPHNQGIGSYYIFNWAE